MTYSQEARASAFQPLPGTDKVCRWRWHLPRRHWKWGSLVARGAREASSFSAREITDISKLVITLFVSPSPNRWNHKALLSTTAKDITDTNLFLDYVSVNTALHRFPPIIASPFSLLSSVSIKRPSRVSSWTFILWPQPLVLSLLILLHSVTTASGLVLYSWTANGQLKTIKQMLRLKLFYYMWISIGDIKLKYPWNVGWADVECFKDFGCLDFYICRDTYTHITSPEIKYFVIIGILYRPNQCKTVVDLCLICTAIISDK